MSFWRRRISTSTIACVLLCSLVFGKYLVVYAATALTGRTATLVISASNSSVLSRYQADYVCDGTADEVQFEAALAALPSGGGKIKALEGEYTFASSVEIPDDDIEIEFAAGSKVKIVATGHSLDSTTIHTDTVYYLIGAVNKERVTVRGCWMDWEAPDSQTKFSTSQNSAGIVFNDCSDVLIEDCQVENIVYNTAATHRAWGILLVNCNDFLITHCKTSVCGHEGIGIRAGCIDGMVSFCGGSGNRKYLVHAAGWEPASGEGSFPSNIHVIGNAEGTSIRDKVVIDAFCGGPDGVWQINDALTNLFESQLDITLSGFTEETHIQDLTTDGTYIYSAFEDSIAKHKMNGTFVASNTTEVTTHSGGICYYNANLYSAYSDTFTGYGEVAVRVYSCSDLSYVEQHVLTDMDGGIGCIAYFDGYFYVGELQVVYPHDIRIFKYDTSFDLQETITIIEGVSEWNGIETIERVGAYWLLGAYGSGRTHMVCDNNFHIISKGAVLDVSRGCASLGNNLFLRGYSVEDETFTGHAVVTKANWEKLNNSTPATYTDYSSTATITGDDVSTVFRVPHTMGLEGYDSTKLPIMVMPKNGNMASAEYWVSDCDSDAIEVSFAAAPTDGESYTFALWVGRGNRIDDNAVVAFPQHLIADAATLRLVRDAINGDTTYEDEDAASANYLLTDNIQLLGGSTDADWEPIGSSTVPFTGKFDGGSYAIDDVTITEAAGNKGLFGKVSGATIKNLGLTNVSIANATTNAGGLVGWATIGSLIDTCTSAGAVSGATAVGGLVGRLDSYSLVNESSSAATVTASSDLGGGLVGYCLNYGNLTTCSATGAVTCPTDAGGLVGKIYTANATDCYATGAVANATTRGGGFAGYITLGSTVQYCYADGAVTEAGGSFHGGFVGTVSLSTTIEDCYATGAATGNGRVAGFVGYFSSGAIKTSHGMGAVTGSTNTGGFCGQLVDGVITTCYYSDATGMSDEGKGVLVEAGNYTTEGSFTGFDFTNDWTMGLTHPEQTWE